MKKYNILFNILFFLVSSAVLTSCGEDDSEKEWGNTLVYMPQAAMLNGGLSNTYPVPFSDHMPTANYVIDEKTNKLRIVLGVYRSGLQKLESFSVNVKVDTEATIAAASSTIRGVVLPQELYSLPQEVNVNDGEREKVFYLDIDLEKLTTDYSIYSKNKLVLVVGIGEPSKYELNEKLSKTTIVIDGSTFIPAPPVVMGGDFEAGSEQYWTSQYLYNLPQNPSGIIDGKLVFDYGKTPVRGDYVWYQEIELEKDVVYTYSCDVTFDGTNGSDAGFRFFTIVTENKPVDGVAFAYATETDASKNFSFACTFDAWTTFPTSGQAIIPQFGKEYKLIDKGSGEFKSTITKGYIVLSLQAWAPSSPGRITFDNIVIKAK